MNFLTLTLIFNMLLNPIQNHSAFTTAWIQKRPVVTQYFGERPEVYRQFGLAGHNGIDFRAKVGTPIHAPISGVAKVVNAGKEGYGLHIYIRGGDTEVVLGHLSKVNVKTGDRIYLGDKIAESGNTGFSSGPHLHLGMRKLIIKHDRSIWDYPVENKNNGYNGWLNIDDKIITWKGTSLVNNL